MNPFVQARLRRASLFVFVAAAALGTACTGGNLSTLPPAASGLGRNVRLAYRVHQPTPEGYLEQFDPERRAIEEAAGTQFLASEMVSPRIPATGHYLRIGDRMIQSGPDGVFQIPNDLSVPAKAPIFIQLSDTEPLAEVSIASALRPSTEPVATVDVRVDCQPFPDSDGMDFGTIGRSRAAKPKSCCARSGTRAALDCERKVYSAAELAQDDDTVSACDDFSDKVAGRVGAKVLCGIQRFVEFPGTPCYEWTFGANGKSAACIGERAIKDFGAGCFRMHKFRFCQNMSPTDFNAEALGSVRVGVSGSVKIKVHNKTPANETQVSLSNTAEGVLVGPVSQGEIKHYSDETKKHLNDVEIEWLAPSSLPDGVAEATETITFKANGITRQITIKVVQNCTDSRGRQVPCK